MTAIKAAHAPRNAATPARRPLSVLAGLALAGLAAGCTAWPLDRQLTSATMLEPTPLDGYQYGLAEEMPLSRAFVELPYLSGKLIAVREKRYANGVEQIMVLESEAIADGENRVEVRVTQSSSADDRIKNEYLQVRSSRQEQIRSDMKEFVWGVPMRIVASVEANAYGTYGYALGRSKLGFNCLLGWQNVKGVMKAKRDWGFMSSRSTDMSLRFRICRSDLSEAQLVSIIRGFRITFDPAALNHEPKMVWRNDGINVSGTYGGDGAVPGYITEGLAPGAAAPSVPDVEPLATQPVAVSRATPVTPRTTTTKPAPKTAPKSAPNTTPKAPPRRTADGELISKGDPSELERLDPDRNQTTIFVDPREYAAVPMPGDVANAPNLSNGSATGAQGNNSRFTVPGKTAPLATQGATGGAQSDQAREQRKEMIRQIPLGGETLSSAPSAAGGAGGLSGGDRGLFLAPEKEGYRGLDLQAIQRGTVEGDNAKHNLWLNDVARDDRDGMPLGRPCELLRDANCQK